ncbi:AAA family ATPase [Bifidobacterium ruminantium]|uniref:AAA family ATPase n=1 Tax=Bifidobacterium ruminantium TaxID=78346 RepID=UPI001C214AD8|nr:SbcC/MukB-like Walker B domain-containing protein [Bifidobacterium ruminantium]MBU9112395.1 AAA family ATPase [Bifidobacterium ruminantium]
MKLIALKFRGVGPYKGEYAIDFAALTRSHMFLIDGETGAGKTTLLDCVTFALYGSISGNTENKIGVGDRNRLRSRFLEASADETYVHLIFEEGGHCYAVRRTPEYERPKQRGDGTTKQNATGKMVRVANDYEMAFAALTDDSAVSADAGSTGGLAAVDRYFDFLDEPGHTVAVASRASEVGKEVVRLLGLDRSQFSKTIMLAQGQFAQFLRMGPEDRTKLVKELFGAEEYEAIQDELDTKRKEFGDKVDGQRAALEERIRAARENAERIVERLESGRPSVSDSGESDTPDGQETSETRGDAWRWGLNESGAIDEPARNETDIVEQLQATLRDVEADAQRLLAQTESQVSKADDKLTEAQRRNEAACELRESYEETQSARNRADELESRKPDIAKQRRQIAQARQAAPIVAKQAECEAAQAKLDDCNARIADIATALANCESKKTLQQRHQEAVAAAAGEEAANKALEIAQTHAENLRKATKAAEQVKQASQKVEACEAAQTKAQQEREALPDAKATASQLEEIAGKLGARGQLEDALTQAKAVLQHAQTAEQLAEQIEAAKSACQAARQARSEAETDVQHAEEALRLAGAARYAEDLDEGQECPVCGSTTHPHLAVRPADVLSEKAVKTLRKQASACADRESDAKAALEKLRARLDGEREQSHGLDEAAAEQGVTNAQTALDGLETLEQQQRALKTQQKQIDAAEKTLTDAHNALAQARTVAQAASDQAETAAKAAEGITQESVDAERADAEHKRAEAKAKAQEAETLSKRIAERDALEQQNVSLQAMLKTLNEQRETMKQAVAQLLENSDFADYESASAAALDEDEIERLQSRIDDFGKAYAAADADVKRTYDRLTKRLETCRKLFDETSYDVTIVDVAEDADVPASMASVGSAETSENADVLEIAEQLLQSLDFAALAETQNNASQKRDDAISAQQTALDLNKDRAKIAVQLTKAAQTWQTGMTDFAPVRTMALLATASKDSPSGQKVSLITFAVTERFRDVLDRANELLKDIHGGVYELRLGTHEGRAGGKTGLPIEVFDRRTERSTEPSTLSGGETFFVSLALALALADVIQAENGGISMETLFIDEGFGSLSDEYLDDVMDVLDGIARTRDIGIISHVGQLKDRVRARVSVSRVSENGESRLTVMA